MTNTEERVWKYLLAHRQATAQEVALNCDVTVEEAEGYMSRISSPNWREELKALQAASPDNVSQPSHYTNGKIECIDYIKDALSAEEYQGYLRGNITKYLHRFRGKNGVEDLKKARVYLDWLIDELSDVPAFDEYGNYGENNGAIRG